MVRVIDLDLLEGGAERIASARDERAFVTAAEDVAGVRTARELAERLTLLNREGSLRTGPFALLEFETPSGIASALRSDKFGFIGSGRTAGGIREFLIENLRLDELKDLTIRVFR